MDIVLKDVKQNSLVSIITCLNINTLKTCIITLHPFPPSLILALHPFVVSGMMVWGALAPQTIIPLTRHVPRVVGAKFSAGKTPNMAIVFCWCLTSSMLWDLMSPWDLVSKWMNRFIHVREYVNEAKKPSYCCGFGVQYAFSMLLRIYSCKHKL